MFLDLSQDCDLLQNHIIGYDNVEDLLVMLMNLYIKALALPMDADEAEQAERSYFQEHIRDRIKFNMDDYYAERFEQMMPKEMYGVSLAGDLYDIASDLCDGIDEYNAGNYKNAAFEWRLGLDIHWRNHVVDAIWALQHYRTE